MPKMAVHTQKRMACRIRLKRKNTNSTSSSNLNSSMCTRKNEPDFLKDENSHTCSRAQ